MSTSVEPAPSRRRLRTVSLLSIPMLIVTGLATLTAAPATGAVVPSAVPLPAGAESFAVAPALDGTSSDVFMTSDAQRVFFTSTASGLVTGDDNGVSDVFVAAATAGAEDPFDGTLTLVSAPDAAVGAAHADGASWGGVASANGRYAAFVSEAQNLTSDAVNPGVTHVYVRDLVTDRTYRVQGPEAPDGDSYEPDLSDDGLTLVFTSTATNFADSGADHNPDAFIADLDANDDGTIGDMAFTRVWANLPTAATTVEPQISGNARFVVAKTTSPSVTGQVRPDTTSPDALVRFEPGSTRVPVRISLDGDEASIDATGHVIAWVSDTACTDPAVIATVIDLEVAFSMALGDNNVDRAVGDVTAPSISADGSTIAWSTTQPEFDYDNPVHLPLDSPVIRMQQNTWWGATAQLQCDTITSYDWTDLGEGTAPSLSVSARTVAYASSEDSATGHSVRAIDRHTHDGLSVTATQGELVAPGFMTASNFSEVSLAGLTGYASALANAPVHRLPVHRLPVHRLPVHRLPVHRLPVHRLPVHRLPVHRLLIEGSPVHRLPVHRLPVHRLDIPGGWQELLALTPYGGDLIQTVTLDEVLAWAAANAGSADPAIAAAAERIQSLTLDDVDLDNSGIDRLSLASLILGSALLSELDIAGTGGGIAAWQQLVDDQGLGIQVVQEAVLAELDLAGLAIDRTGVEGLTLRDLPIDDTLFDEMLVASDITSGEAGLYLAGTPLGARRISSFDPAAQTALFGAAVPDGTLAEHAAEIEPTATVADLAAGAPADVTFGELLFSLLDLESYPWEQIDPADLQSGSVDESPGTGCTSNLRCGLNANFRFAFDVGPGEETAFTAPTATVDLPAGTVSTQVFAAGSGPDVEWSDYSEYGRTVERNGATVRLPLDDTAAGTVVSFDMWYSETVLVVDSWASGTLESAGRTTASSSVALGNAEDVGRYDDFRNNREIWSGDTGYFGLLLDPNLVYFEWITPEYVRLNDEGGIDIGAALDEDWYRVRAPKANERLIVSTNANDGQIVMSLYRPEGAAAPLGTTDASAAPGTAVTDQTGGDASSGADAGTPVDGHTLVDEVSIGGDGGAQIEAASTSSGDEELLLRVTSGNGLPSESLYSVRVRYLEEPGEVRCTPTTAPTAAAGTSDAIDDTTNTLFLFDTQRYAALHGPDATEEVIDAINNLDGVGADGSTVNGAIVALDADSRYRERRDALDQNPCSMSARAALVTAGNTAVTQLVGDHADQITSVVIVGGDDVVPFAPVAQNTAQFNEASHAADLRRESPPGTPEGTPCPVVAAGEADPCATPLSAAAATNFILTDDPYGFAKAYSTLGGHLYVPTVGVGRLVDSHRQILDALDRFVVADGMLAADSTLTAGYGAWSELPAEVTQALDWRSDADQQLSGTWDRATTEAALYPETGSTARIVSINTHADERFMLPGISGAESGRFAETDLLEASTHVNAPELAAALVFLIGCHAGNNLPTSYYGDVADWADVFSTAGGFVGNTGYGLANSESTALSERLLSLYADWLGVTVGDRTVTTAQALTIAKQAYLGQLGLYSGYDEKVLMQSVYYGLPMYTLSEATPIKEAPLPQVPDTLSPVAEGTAGVLSAGLTLSPVFTRPVAPDGQVADYLVADGQAPAVVPGQAVLPRIVARLYPAPDGQVPRGVLLTGLASVVEGEITSPTVAAPSVGVPETSASPADASFPSSFATISRQETPTGPIDLLVATPARVTTRADGTGMVEKFTSMTLEATYGPASSTDVTPPTIAVLDSASLHFSAVDRQSGVVGAVALIQRKGQMLWERIPLKRSDGDIWSAVAAPEGEFRWIIQAVDAAGNVATDTARGRLPLATYTAYPTYETGGDAQLVMGERLKRTFIVTDVEPGQKLTGTAKIIQGDDRVVAADVLTIETGRDGVTRAVLDTTVTTPGALRVELEICQGSACTPGEFGLSARFPNTAPSVEVTITSSNGDVRPTSTLTAHATPTDVDGDDVTVTYLWEVNGVAAGAGAELALGEGVAPGDVVTVWATPNDGTVDGHRGKASATVTSVPAAPTITATATRAAANGEPGGPYTEGTWSRSAVTVVFTCDSGASVVSCPANEVVEPDTSPEGTTVHGIVRDTLGRSASTSLVVKVDASGPVLNPTADPATVPVGGTVTLSPNAEDAASGVVSAECAAPDTASAGTKSAQCSATNGAGITSTASVAYTVSAPQPPTCRGVLDRTALAPVNADGSSVFLRTSGVPVVFRACAPNGSSIGTKNFVKSVTLVSSSPLAAGTRVNEAWYLPVPKFTYVNLTQTWVGAIQTAKLKTGMRYTYRVNLADGTSFTVTFGVR